MKKLMLMARNMQRRVEFLVKNQRIVGDLHLPEDFDPPYPVVVTSHGWKSHRGSKKYFQIGYRFPLEGIAVLRFDHRGALKGESEGKFENMFLTTRVEDLATVLDSLKKFPEIDSQRIGLIGSSLGGLTNLVLLKDERIKAIVFLATPFGLPRLKIEVRESLEKNGFYQFPDGTIVRKEFYEDMAKYDFRKEAKKINCPTLIIHGKLDKQVPPHQARILYETIGSEIKELKYIEGGGHAFTNPEKLNEVLGYVLDFFKKYLKGGD